MNPRILCCSILLVATPVLGAELEYGVSGGFTHSDNIERLPDGLERSSSAAVARLELSGARPTGRLRYDVATDLSYNEYLSLDLDSEVFGRGAVQGEYDFIQDTFGWNGRLSYEQVRADILTPLAPGNTEGLLTFSTGPTLRARFSGVLEGELDGHYVRTSYGNRPFDNETVGGRSLLIRRANPRTMLGLGVSYDDVSYISGGAPSGLDFNRREIFTRMELQGVRTDIDLEVGYASVKGQSVDDGGAMLRASLRRRISPSLTGFVSAVREYPTSDDVARSFDSTGEPGGGYDSGLLTSGPRQSTRLEGGFRFERVRMNGEIAYSRREEQAETGLIAERTMDELRAQVGRRFTPNTRGTLVAGLTKEDISGTVGSTDERRAGAEFAISFGRSLGMDLRVEHRKRDGRTALDSYSELSGGVFLRYSGAVGGQTDP
jgi:hypothetical protein